MSYEENASVQHYEMSHSNGSQPDALRPLSEQKCSSFFHLHWFPLSCFLERHEMLIHDSTQEYLSAQTVLQAKSIS